VIAAISRGSADDLESRLALDYRFTSNDPDFVEMWPDGYDRWMETSLLRLQHQHGVRERIAAVSRVDVHPPVNRRWPVPGTYIVRLSGVRVEFTFADGIVVDGKMGDHVFEVLCQPAPLAARGRSEGRCDCLVRRWTETVAADTADTASLVTHPPASGDRPLALAIRVLANGHGGATSLELSLPAPGDARLEMFDIAGRRVDSRDLPGLRTGTHAIGLPGQLASGVYWARLNQGKEMRTARVVVVR
jgi:hypothetical protein